MSTRIHKHTHTPTCSTPYYDRWSIAPQRKGWRAACEEGDEDRERKKNKHQTDPEEEDKDTFLQTELINIFAKCGAQPGKGSAGGCGKADVNETGEKESQPDGERRVSPHSSPGSSLEVRALGFCFVFSPSILSDGHILTPGDPPPPAQDGNVLIALHCSTKRATCCRAFLTL